MPKGFRNWLAIFFFSNTKTSPQEFQLNCIKFRRVFRLGIMEQRMYTEEMVKVRFDVMCVVCMRVCMCMCKCA